MTIVNDRTEFLNEVKKLVPNNCTVAELGVLYGDLSEMILDILNPEKLALIDPYNKNNDTYQSGLTTAYSDESDYQNLIRRFENEIIFGTVTVIRKFSYDAVKDYPDGSFDLVYIDACHLYEDVKRDLNDWLPKLKSGAIISGHDYDKIADFGVIEAVDEFAKDNKFEMVIFNKNGGDWALKKIHE